MNRALRILLGFIGLVLLVVLQLGLSNLFPSIAGAVWLPVVLPLLLSYYDFEYESLGVLLVVALAITPFSNFTFFVHLCAGGLALVTALVMKHRFLKGVASHTAVAHVTTGTVAALAVYWVAAQTPLGLRGAYVDLTLPAYGWATAFTLVGVHAVLALGVYLLVGKRRP